MGIFDLESREALIGTPTVTVAANRTGNVLERLEFIGDFVTSPVRSVALSLGIPLPMSEPVDRTITENTTFEDAVVHYYRNLTIAPGVTVKLRNGPMIFVVEGDLTIGEGAVIDGDGLGGRGAVLDGISATGLGGYGGNFWNFAVARTSPDPNEPLLVMSNQALALAVNTDSGLLSISYPLEVLVALILFGLENNGLSNFGNANGRAWEEPSFWGATGLKLMLYRALVFAIFSRMTYDPIYGGLGGGGGGTGAGATGSSISVPGARYYAGKGHDGDANGEPGTGGLGFGGGGSGGTKSNSGYWGQGGNGGNGGGTQLWIVRRINNAGTIRSNGTDGGPATTGTRLAGGGGGGGGGCAALIYGEVFGAGVGIWQAHGGAGGPGNGEPDGGMGGAGLVKTVQLIV